MAGYVPDQRPRLQQATRFFARPQRFTLECPACGIIYTCNSAERQVHWDYKTATFRCDGFGGCERSYVIGILAWPTTGKGRGKPRDQVPDPRQLASLRAEGGGWWMPDGELRRSTTVHETNLTTEMERPTPPEEGEE